MRARVILLAVALCITASAQAQDGGWTQLFDGKDLKGWQHVGEGDFVVEDGVLKTQGGMGLLWYTGQKFENEVIRVVYKNPGGKNAGVFVRIPYKPAGPWMPVYQGYEAQIDDHEDLYHYTGTLYSLTKARAKASKPGEWNTMEITLDGPRTLVKVNGVLVTDYTEGEPVPPKKQWYEPDRGQRPIAGYIGLQNHGPDDIVYFKEVSVKPL